MRQKIGFGNHTAKAYKGSGMKSEIREIVQEIRNAKTPTGKCGHCKEKVTEANSGGSVDGQVYCEPCLLEHLPEILGV